MARDIRTEKRRLVVKEGGMYHVGEEWVRGIIIGPVTWPYEFWTEPKKHEPEQKRLIAKHHFENDREAVAWFKEHCPAEYKAGAEMRCFDQPPVGERPAVMWEQTP